MCRQYYFCYKSIVIYKIQFTAKNRRSDSYNSTQTKHLHNSVSTGTLAVPPTVPPRRHSVSKESFQLNKSKDEADLISFTNTSDEQNEITQPTGNDSHSQFIKLVDDMYKYKILLLDLNS